MYMKRSKLRKVSKQSISKICKSCKREFPIEHYFLYGYKLHTLCQECEKERHRKKTKKYYWANLSTSRENSKIWNKTNRERVLENNRNYRNSLRKEVIEHYGGNPPKCACCGESERIFLTIDHIERHGGKKERDLLKGGGHHNYRHIKRLNFPNGIYRVLCYNCNCGRERNNGICPHEKN